MYQLIFKPILDILLSLLALILFLPVFLFIIIMLTIVNHGNPFFIQQRPGKNGKLFKIIKFKTMNDDVDKNGNLLPNIKRLTIVGKIVRKTSLDEIPQLINVLKGDMSLIGPRPLLPEYLPMYNEEQKIRHKVKPGITGWAQVNGRNALTWTKKFEYDIYYVKNYSFILDIKIIIKTIQNIFFAKNIYSKNNKMVKFNGKN